MTDAAGFTLVWLTGPSCDGCTIRALGDPTAGGLEAVLGGSAGDLPGVRLLHSLLSAQSGAEFAAALERAAAGELGPYGVVNEASVPDDDGAAPGFFSSLGVVGGRSVSVGEWLDRLAPRAQFVVAWGDCAVWGGPHSLHPNPTGATGTAAHLGRSYASVLGLPVVNLPGCAPPPVLLSTLEALLRRFRGTGPAPELDSLNRPEGAYSEGWKGAFGPWAP